MNGPQDMKFSAELAHRSRPTGDLILWGYHHDPLSFRRRFMAPGEVVVSVKRLLPAAGHENFLAGCEEAEG